MSRRLAAALAALAALALPASAAAAGGPRTDVTGIAPAGAGTARVSVRATGDLSAADVEATLGGKLAFVAGVHRIGPSRPLDLVFALDTSGSMRGTPLQQAEAAGERLLESVGRSGRVGLVLFNNRATVVQPLTRNAAAVRSALRSLSSGQGTALYDGVAAAVRAAGRNPGARRVVVVLSDGADTASHTDLAAARRLALASGVEIDAVGLSSSSSFTPAPLQELASVTGGRLLETASASGLEPMAAQLAQAQLAHRFAVDVELPATGARTLRLSVRGAPAASVALPAGVSGEDGGFWALHGAALVSLLAFAAIAWTLVSISRRRGRALPLAARLKPYSSEGRRAARSAKVERAPLLLEQYEWLEARLGERGLWKRLEHLCLRAGVVAPTAQILLVSLGLGLAGLVVGAAVLGLMLAPLAGVALALLPIAAIRFRARRRQNRFEQQLPELLGVMASALRAGRSFAQALDSLVEEADEPALSEFRRAQQQVRLGVPIEQALDEMSRRIGSESFELVVLTTDVQRRIGGNVAEIFDQVADAVRKRQQFAARVKALTSMGRMSGNTLLGLPFVLAGLLTLINRAYMRPLFFTGTGHLLMAIALVMMVIGAIVLRQMVKPRAMS